MELVEHLAFPSDAGPVPVGPGEPGGVHYLGRPVWSLGLEAGRGIGEGITGVQPVTVPGPRGEPRHQAGVVAAPLRGEESALPVTVDRHLDRGWDALREERYRRMIDLSAAKRAGTPDEVGTVGALLMGPHGGFITGSDFLMDGGVTATYWFGGLAPQ